MAQTAAHPARPDVDTISLGTSTSAMQNEGASATRAATIWDQLADDGMTADGSDPSIASDHLAHMDDDVALIAELGVATHRFSISWARVMPDETQTVSEAGLDHYDRLVDRLLDRGIEPIAALHHRDLPIRHHEAGGWRDAATVDAFVDFTGAAAARLGDRVTTWSTLHDPTGIAGAAADADGRAELTDQLAIAHRSSRRMVRAHCPGGRIGIDVTAADLRLVDVENTDLVFLVHDGSAGALRTALTTIRHLHPEMPVYVTERGIPSHDGADLDGVFDDDDRIREMSTHIEAVVDARRSGAAIEGYLTPLLDGFEWAEGLRLRTGLVRVDFDTKTRIPKESYRWLRSLARADDSPA